MRTHAFIFTLVLFILILVQACAGQAGTGTGFYYIESDPSDAQVLVDNIYRGNTPVTVAVSSMGTPGNTILVSKPGYYPWTRTYDKSPTPGETIGVVAVLSPSYDFGTLIVTSNPTGALVTVDGGKGQQAPWTYTDIQAGSHVVRAILSGYQPYLTLVDIPPKGTVTVQATLPVLSDVGVIQVKSNPGGADVYVDGFYSGATSVTIGNLAAGPHFVQIRMAGYNEWIDTVQVLPNQVTIIDATLVLTPPGKTGSMVVSSTPPGASVYLDGTYKGITQPSNTLDLTSIPAGFHDVKLTLASYQDYTASIQVQAGGTAVVNAVMVPSGSQSSTGILQVDSAPQGANVFLDNSIAGVTPLTLQAVQVGPHTVLVRLAGYNDYSTTVTIEPSKLVEIDAALAPAPTRGGIETIVVIAGAFLAFFVFGRKS